MNHTPAPRRLVRMGVTRDGEKLVDDMRPWGYTKADPRQLKRRRRAANAMARINRRRNR